MRKDPALPVYMDDLLSPLSCLPIYLITKTNPDLQVELRARAGALGGDATKYRTTGSREGARFLPSMPVTRTAEGVRKMRHHSLARDGAAATPHPTQLYLSRRIANTCTEICRIIVNELDFCKCSLQCVRPGRPRRVRSVYEAAPLILGIHAADGFLQGDMLCRS